MIGLRAAIARPEAVDEREIEAEYQARKRDRNAAGLGLVDVSELADLPRVLAIRARRQV